MQNNKPQEYKIDYRFKLLYAIGMIMVVAGHCNGGGISLINDWFPYRGLHLPLFVFCSGYFYQKRNEDDVIHYCIKKLKTLVIPLYIYTLAYGLIVKVLNNKGGLE
jgi:fucose 4-O-acetylase-like acetyltransferase